MQGIVRGTLVTAIAGIIGDFSDDSKVKIRRMINTVGPEFCQLTDWAFLHTTVTFTLTDGNYSYVGSGYLSQTFQRFLATKLKDSTDTFYPISEKSLTWYNELDDPADEGRPFAVVLRGLDSSGYPRANFYYCPDGTYTFETDCELKWTDLAEASGSDTSRIVITEDCMTAFSFFVAGSLAVPQGDDALIDRCNAKLWGNPLLRIPGALDVLIRRQRGANKKRRIKPSDAYIDTGERTATDYGRELK